MPRVIYRGERGCQCIALLEDWYSQDRTQIDDLAEVECDCGKRWVFNLKLDGSGWYWHNDNDPKLIG